MARSEAAATFARANATPARPCAALGGSNMARGGVDYIPRPDGDFNGWASHYYDAVKAWWEVQGLDPTDLKPLEMALAEWNTAFPAHVAAAAAAEAARQGKDTSRVSLEAEIRPVAQFVQTYFKTTDADRANMGITVRSSRGGTGVPPVTRPLVRVDTSQRLLHTLRFSDESTPTRRRKPRGVLGAEVWVALAAPHDPPPLLRFAGEWKDEGQALRAEGQRPKAERPSEHSAFGLPPSALFRFLAVSTSGTLQTDFSTAEAGQTAYYALRWLSTRGETGPWSEIAAATVAA
jgi:hypothetical protein